MPNDNIPLHIHSSSRTENNFLMDELIVDPPNWLLRSGITVLLFAVLAGLMLSWVVKYPDKIAAPFILTSENPPITVVSKVSAVIDTVLYEDQMCVSTGTLIAIMESTANWEDVYQLENWLSSIQPLQSADLYVRIEPPRFLEIGPLKTVFSQLLQEIQELQYILAEQLTAEKIESIDAEIKQIDLLIGSLRKQEGLFIRELELVRKDYERSKELNVGKALSDKELESIEAGFLRQKRALEGIRLGIIQNEIQKRQLNSQRIEIIQNRRKDLDLRFVAIQETIGQLFEDLTDWKQLHFVYAPIPGKLHYVEGFSDKQFIHAGEPVVTLLPLSGRGTIKGKTYLPPFNIGKVLINNDVHIRLDAYPDKEFGVIKAKVNQIATLPIEDEEGNIQYIVESYLSDSLLTTFNRSIAFKQKLSGTATIITEEKRLINRLFENIFKALDVY